MVYSWEEIDLRRNMLLSNALAPNTVSTYRTGINHYRRFCAMYDLQALPLREQYLELFVTHLHTTVGHDSIGVYLCGVQFWAKMHGDYTIIAEMPRLEYVMMAIRRVQGNSFRRPPRTPITWDMLNRICDHIDNTESAFDAAMLKAAVLLAFFGMLRVSEYTALSAHLNEHDTLAVQDVRILWDRRVACIRINHSKTDPFRFGVTIRIAMIDHRLCPVRALHAFITARGSTPGPLFMFQNGMFLTRQRIVDLLHCSLPGVPNVNTHSFRRGGASALAAAGTPPEIIMILGRWKSNAFREYITFSDSFLAAASWSMIPKDN